MNKQDLIKAAAEAMDCTARLIESEGCADCAKIGVFSPEALSRIEREVTEELQNLLWGKTSIYTCGLDSFEAASYLEGALVLNFANAHTPGGGFLNGARAQEESLCRCSTLYASLKNPEAAEMYEYNKTMGGVFSSDYMLMSPSVLVFRSHTGHWLDFPFWTGVVTVPAPNRRGAAAAADPAELAASMKARLRKMLCLAVYCNRRNIVLGAWGCGAFGNSAYNVSGYFYELLIEEGYGKFFENIVFAILGDPEKLNVFENAFKGELEPNFPSTDLIRAKRDREKKAIKSGENAEWSAPLNEPPFEPYYTALYNYPVCNHTVGVGRYNAGYAKGVFCDGIPFEAEIYGDDHELSIVVIMPAIFSEGSSVKLEEGASAEFFEVEMDEIPFGKQKEDRSVLDIGMEDLGEEEDPSVINAYIAYLESRGLIDFASNTLDGAVFNRKDAQGNDLVKINLGLLDDGAPVYYTNLEVMPFPVKPTLKIVK